MACPAARLHDGGPALPAAARGRAGPGSGRRPGARGIAAARPHRNAEAPAPGNQGAGARDAERSRTASYFFFPVAESSLDSTAMKASWGTSTEPTIFIRFLPSFCFSSSFRLREMSPP